MFSFLYNDSRLWPGPDKINESTLLLHCDDRDIVWEKYWNASSQKDKHDVF